MNDNIRSFYPSTEIYHSIINRVVENEDSPYSQMMRKANDIDIDYFDAVRNHKETLHEDLNMGLMEKIVGVFEVKAKELLTDSKLEERLLEEVKGCAEVVKDKMGERAYEDYLTSLAAELEGYADGMEIKPRFPKYTNEDLRLKYEAAKRITLKERLMTSNVYDITAYHNALQDRTWWECRVLVTDRTREFLLRLAEGIKKLI